jgi:glycerol-3-phosphate O-acyltransferase
VYKLKNEDKVNCATHFKSQIDIVIRQGLENVGIFHLKRPLLFNKEGNIITQDLNTLYYYHNRLVGYDLEKFI